ncbi:conjugal transfer protein [Salmonella enterica]|nr:conjugal transfer protein [Salmonella enterica]EFO8530369.1 conjugal transfer protein [Salmonella enterica]EGG4120866.1 conjugal transfer protein [Salmonella enterica]EGG4135138.1 conjugal transfer protein [Salmonella enterica]EGG4280891.1 conjugal transfer protein [Salmonella enterica]
MSNIELHKVKTIKVALLCLLAFIFTANPALAAGGLDDMTDLVNDVQFWIYTIDFAVAGCAISIVGIMWYIGRKDQGDFLITLGITAAVGGGIAAVTYVWSIWGTAV